MKRAYLPVIAYKSRGKKKASKTSPEKREERPPKRAFKKE